MSFTPENCAIRLTPEQEAEVQKMLPDAMQEYFRRLAVEQGLATRDYYSPDVLVPTENPQPAGSGYAREIEIRGQRFLLTASSEGEWREHYERLLQGTEATTQTSVEQPRDESGRFIAREETHDESSTEAATEAELRLKMMRGEISPDEFVIQSGAMDRFLKEKYGLDSAEILNTKFQQSWERATTDFLASSDWPGGTANQQRMLEIINENGLQDQPSKETLEQVYEFMRENSLIVPNPEIENHRAIASANDPASLRAAAAKAIGLPEQPPTGYNVLWGK